ncbi:penicillin-binding protein [Dactylosporangium sp. CA-052675]|uniref:penicillin-binding protein n=1 Tax=Dactylosporangium sp. CA-052675 TaxID=3239927 RepID=UPI003D910680
MTRGDDSVARVRIRRNSLLPSAASLLLCGLLAGLVVAGAAFPVVAMSGLAAKTGSDTFESMSSDLVVLPSPQISYVLAADGKTRLAMMYDENRRDVKIDDVAPVMQQAMVAAEDNRFYEHRGVDVKGVARAFVANQNAGGTEQGASTLTMQYVRQAIAYSAQTPQEVVDATGKTSSRKLREMKYAIDLEKKLSKKEILERYLNIAPFGHGAYGVYAAAHVYFDKDPKDLTLPESALIAGLVKAPGTNDPATEKGYPEAVKRQKYVLNQMVSMGYIDKAAADAAATEKLTIVGKRTPEGCESIQASPELGAGFFCDYLRRWWDDQKVFGEDEYQRANRLRAGGYTIITSLDIQTQTAAAKYAQEQPKDVAKNQQIHLGNSSALMLAAIQPGTGRVTALATNRTFSNDQSGNKENTNPGKKGQKGNYPNTTVPIITGDADIPGYQAGSAFKMFTAVAALESGLPLATTIQTEKQFVSDFILNGGGPATCNGNHYCPKNSGGQSGPYNMWTAFGSSINTYFVPLEQQVGVKHVVDVAKRLGIQFNAKEDADLAAKPDGWGAFTLGVSATTPLQLANAYGTLAADGLYCEPTPILEVKDNSGKKVEGLDPKCRQVVDPEVARAAVDMARCPVGDQSATSRCNGATAQYARGFVKRQIAGKSGTTDSEKSATFTVMTKQLAVSGFLTDPDWPETTVDMQHAPVNYAALGVLRDGLAGQPEVKFTAPTKDRAQGKLVDIPSVKCLPVDQARDKVAKAGFSVTVAAAQVPSKCPGGTVDRTNPGGATTKGGPVQLVVSNGQPE